jgi:D-alanine--poly(phosphoribitol) ligase subunit 1
MSGSEGEPSWMWGGPSVPPCLLASFHEQTLRVPGQVAVEDGDRQFSYAELSDWVRQAARALVDHGVREDDRVAVVGPRSVEVCVAMLAIVLVGAVYTPLDSQYPADRVAYMLGDSGARLVVCCGGAEPPPASQAQVLPMPAYSPAETGTLGLPLPACRPEAGVYVIYTSGSTGWPKGVQLPHRSIDNMVEWQRRHSVRPDLRTAQFAPLNFDVCFQEILGTLCGGGTLVIVPEPLRHDSFDLLAWVRDQRIERLFVPFLALQMIAVAHSSATDGGLALREVNVAGEPLVCTPEVRHFFARQPQARLNNHYGQSESAMVTVHTLTGSSDSWPVHAPIGLPLPGCELLIDPVDENDAALGELLVAGAPLSTGYLGQPELNARRYIALHTPRGHSRVFRTGDMVQRQADGALRILGRTDLQVKIRGHRVDLQEIEAVLLEQEGIREAVTVTVDRGEGTRTLHSAVSLDPDLPLFDEQELLAALARRLPSPSVPLSIVVIPALPRTPSGKADRGKVTDYVQDIVKRGG